MAIANGTCVSFCNQPKAHFGLHWVRPWDNRGKYYMETMLVKRIAAYTYLSSTVYELQRDIGWKLQLFPTTCI